MSHHGFEESDFLYDGSGKQYYTEMKKGKKALNMGTLNNKCSQCGKVFTCEYEQNTAAFFFANACDVCPECHEKSKRSKP